MINKLLRFEMIDYLKGLSDKNYQKKTWVLKQNNSKIENDELNYAIHFFFDDTVLAENPESLIGVCLKNKDEANAVFKVCSSLDNIFKKYGYELSDEEYIELPSWNKVIKNAQDALSIIKES